MLAYVPDHVPTLSSLCPVCVPGPGTGTGSGTGNTLIDMSLLHAPQMYLVPLPLPNAATTSTCGQPVESIYPLNISLVSPIHLHTPMAHIGELHRDTITPIPGQHTTALDIFLSIQSILRHVKATFYQCAAVSLSTHNVTWERFTTGQFFDGGPLGIDLLLGNTQGSHIFYIWQNVDYLSILYAKTVLLGRVRYGTELICGGF
ncbi:hypothetical protein P691DRAFT_783661 [Macrolepiota fuliginosa MF-IS2]|uniref:Uncharacterized protein n=1 Tax=Macrolepiota fuliginosa MF-IS2 TaxID=1400762 RepID=A0A9P5WWF7_9AGAR|nr:hypothetical protein P691DRAFT_783661 [Macrolepiota fuliginosa MF-IS2]